MHGAAGADRQLPLTPRPCTVPCLTPMVRPGRLLPHPPTLAALDQLLDDASPEAASAAALLGSGLAKGPLRTTSRYSHSPACEDTCARWRVHACKFACNIQGEVCAREPEPLWPPLLLCVGGKPPYGLQRLSCSNQAVVSPRCARQLCA